MWFVSDDIEDLNLTLKLNAADFVHTGFVTCDSMTFFWGVVSVRVCPHNIHQPPIATEVILEVVIRSVKSVNLVRRRLKNQLIRLIVSREVSGGRRSLEVCADVTMNEDETVKLASAKRKIERQNKKEQTLKKKERPNVIMST